MTLLPEAREIRRLPRGRYVSGDELQRQRAASADWEARESLPRVGTALVRVTANVEAFGRATRAAADVFMGFADALILSTYKKTRGRRARTIRKQAHIRIRRRERQHRIEAQPSYRRTR